MSNDERKLSYEELADAVRSLVKALRFYAAASHIPLEQIIKAYGSGDTVFYAFDEYTKAAREALASLPPELLE